MKMRSACAIAALVSSAGLAVADELPLEYNWNALVHSSEVFTPILNVPTGFRAIGDRGFIFGDADSLGGVEGVVFTLEGEYDLEPDGQVVDMLFFGARTPNPDTELWDSEADEDGIGTQPTWDPTGGTAVLPIATTTLATPVAMTSSSSVAFLYHGSQGGESFEVILNFTDSTSVTVTMHAPDWYANGNGVPNAPLDGVESQTLLGGPLSDGDGFYGAAGNDVPVPDAPLNVVEGVISASALLADLGFDVNGKSLESVTFDGTNMLAVDQFVGIGVYGMLVNGTQVDLDYNWNGIVHADELNIPSPNEPSGYRSISDRALKVFGPNSVGDGVFEMTYEGMDYHFNPNAGEPDSIVVGMRPFAWDDQADNDNLGVPPDWDQSGGTGTITEWISFLDEPLLMEADTHLGMLYHGSNGGGDIFVILEFTDGESIELILNTGDWFADFDPGVAPPDFGLLSQEKIPGPLSDGDGWAAVSNVDAAAPGAPLVLFQAVISTESLMDGLGFDAEGRELDFIVFDGSGLGSRAVAFYGASVGDGTVPMGCNGADLADPFGTLNIDDVLAFLSAFAAGSPDADLVDNGTLDIDDVLFFLTTFAGGCP